MKPTARLAHGFMLLALCAIARTASAADTDATRATRALLAEQQAAWNRGDIDGFMQGYLHSDDLRFAGGDSYRTGWQETLARYRRSYPDAASMGRLDFELVEVRELSPVAVYVFGKWHLTRAADPPEKAPHGLFTLIVEKKGDAWFVTRDHTSSAGQ